MSPESSDEGTSPWVAGAGGISEEVADPERWTDAGVGMPTDLPLLPQRVKSVIYREPWYAGEDANVIVPVEETKGLESDLEIVE